MGPQLIIRLSTAKLKDFPAISNTSQASLLKKYSLEHQQPRVYKKAKSGSRKHKSKAAAGLSQQVNSGSSLIDNKHKCSLCNYTVRYRCFLEPHMLTHGIVSEKLARKQLRCEHCSFSSYHKKVFRRHMIIHEPKKKGITNASVATLKLTA
nr:unnamed protein product [Callosobruchus analis]